MPDDDRNGSSEVENATVFDLWSGEISELNKTIPGGYEGLLKEDLSKVDFRDSDAFPRTIAGFRSWQRARDSLVQDLANRGYGSEPEVFSSIAQEARRIKTLPKSVQKAAREKLMSRVRGASSMGILTRGGPGS